MLKKILENMVKRISYHDIIYECEKIEIDKASQEISKVVISNIMDILNTYIWKCKDCEISNEFPKISCFQSKCCEWNKALTDIKKALGIKEV